VTKQGRFRDEVAFAVTAVRACDQNDEKRRGVPLETMAFDGPDRYVAATSGSNRSTAVSSASTSSGVLYPWIDTRT
jgi:hypothetical protein